MKKFKVERYITATSLQLACIDNGWYTLGTNEDYENLFSILRNDDGKYAEMTIDKIMEVMEDIMAHSELDDDDITRVCVIGKLENICVTAFYL
jgi:NDP-sugar pyrophosphorylase family protein